MQETIRSTQRAFDGRLIKVDVHDVELPDGSTSKREVVQHPGAVAVLALDEQNQVLLVRQFRTAAGRVLAEIPAGTLEPGEAPLLCAEREMQEETGYKPGKLQPIGGFFVAPGYTTEYIHLFIATELSESRLNADADEFIAVERVTYSEALAMIERAEIVDGKSIIALLKGARLLNL